MSIRVDSTPLIDGKIVVGDAGHGVKGSVIRATTALGVHGPGVLYNDWDDSSDDDKEFRALILTPPAEGTFFVREDGSFDLRGASDGTHEFQYQLFVDGVAVGSPVTSQIVVGQATVQSDLSATYSVSAGVISDLAATFAVIEAVQRDLSAAYDIEVDGTVLSDFTAAYSVVASVERDLPADYSVLNSAEVDLTASYVVVQSLSADLTATYTVLAPVQRDLSASYSVASSTPGSCDPADIWNYVLPNGKTAVATLLEVHEMLTELRLVHGLDPASPLVVTQTSRTAGAVEQTIATVGGSTTLTRQ